MPKQSPEAQRVVAITGPTAAGKSAVALALAAELDAEIVTCDAMQVYRQMDIGTAKPSAGERVAVAHHCLDLVEASDEFSAADYRQHARAAIGDVSARGRLPLIAGGTGLYLRAAVDEGELSVPPDPARRAELESWALDDLVARLVELDPGRAQEIDLANPRRVLRAVESAETSGPHVGGDSGWHERKSIYDLTIIAVAPRERTELYDAIDARVDAMLGAGWIDEVAALRARARPMSRTAQAAIGYAELGAVIDSDMTLDAARERIKARTRAYARRQLTWFRAEPRARRVYGSGRTLVDAVRAEISAALQ